MGLSEVNDHVDPTVVVGPDPALHGRPTMTFTLQPDGGATFAGSLPATMVRTTAAENWVAILRLIQQIVTAILGILNPPTSGGTK